MTETILEPRKRTNMRSPNVTVIVGGQWGDEGKGKIVDLLVEGGLYDVIVRYQGGPNAGHTVVIDGKKSVLHTIPSGILHPGTLNMIGNGAVVDLEAICKEMDEIGCERITPENLKISKGAHVIFPYHILLEQIRSTSKKIGTTNRGIGPCYTDKIAREGIPFGNLLRPEIANPRIIEKVAAYNNLAREFNEIAAIQNAIPDCDQVEYAPILNGTTVLYKTYALFERLKPYLDDTASRIHELLRERKGILLEGAQGSLLDIDFGTYQYVTSSTTTASGACSGTGLGPLDISEIVGIFKAYTTRVGEGPFPTELDYKTDETGKKLQTVGAEFGATTGRPRRVGWFDMVAAQYVVNINSMSDIVITKLDVLDEFAEIEVCVEHQRDGKTKQFDPLDLADITPIYKKFPGWKTSTKNCKTWDDLPENAKNYLNFLEKTLDTPIRIISVGNDRNATIYKTERAA